MLRYFALCKKIEAGRRVGIGCFIRVCRCFKRNEPKIRRLRLTASDILRYGRRRSVQYRGKAAKRCRIRLPTAQKQFGS